MQLLIDIKNWDSYKENDKLPCKCAKCQKTFFITKNKARRGLTMERPCDFCSLKCFYESTKKLGISEHRKLQCFLCQKEFERYPSQQKNKNFCSKSCATTYNNKHKTHGSNRSKLEMWIEDKIIIKYPKLEIKFNSRTEIGSELDIYIPKLKLAFELNGIVHYEPIYGQEKLDKVRNNDNRKFQACLENNIELAILDTSTLKNFKEDRANKFLDIIIEIINNKILTQHNDLSLVTFSTAPMSPTDTGPVI